MNPYNNPFGYSAVNYGALSPTYQQQSMQPQQLQPISSNQPDSFRDYQPPYQPQTQQYQSFTQPTFSSSNLYASPVRYATLSSEKEPSPFPFSAERIRHSSLSSPQQQYYHQRLSPPPPPVMTVRRDPFDYSPQQRAVYPYGENGMTQMPSDPYYQRTLFDRSIPKQRAESPDFSMKQEFDPYMYKTPKATRTYMSEESESRSFSAPLKAVQKVIPEKEVLITEEYNGKKEFQTMEEAINTLTAWAETQNVVLRKGSGNNKTMKDGTRKKIVLVCQCSGKYRSCSYSPRGGSSASNSSCEEGGQPTTQPRAVKKRRSKKTECPFRINLNYRANSNTWNITKMILEHNHA